MRATTAVGTPAAPNPVETARPFVRTPDARLPSPAAERFPMDVSCIVNAHREAQTILPTLVSVRRAVEVARRTGLEVDIHLVLDRPDIRTRGIVTREMSGAAEIHVVDHGDLAAARNHGVRRSNATYLAFIDGDDLWCPRWPEAGFRMAEADGRPLVLHPEYNVYFGGPDSHVFQHVDMEASDFAEELLLKRNYWTALSFSRRETYLAHPYRENRLGSGFGYEDWTWNHETVASGLLHKVVPGTTHFVRRGKPGESLLTLTSAMRAIPRVLDLYDGAAEARSVTAPTGRSPGAGPA